MREKVVIIRSNVRGVDAFHFCSGRLRVGAETETGFHDLWFPVVGGDLFKSIESVLVLNGIATNVANVSLLRDGDTYQDYEVEYNISV